MPIIIFCRYVLRLTLLLTLALAVHSANAAYRKISTSGAFLPADAALGSGPLDWGCTYDDATELLWEVKTNDGGLRDYRNTYTNYDDPTKNQIVSPGLPPFTYGMPTLADINGDTNSIGFQNAVNAQGLCGFRDWRRPTATYPIESIDELNGLWDPSFNSGLFGGLSVNPDYFPNTSPNVYLSSSQPEPSALPQLIPEEARTWSIHFGNPGNGNISSVRSAKVQYVRLVRSGRLSPLQLEIVGSGAGNVGGGAVDCTRSDAGVNTGVCAVSGGPTQVRTLSATAATGSVFVGWSGCDGLTVDTPPQCVVTTDTAKTVIATFALAHELKVETAGTGAGTVTGGAISCARTSAGATEGICTSLTAAGSAVTLTASAAAGSTFTRWSGCDSLTADAPPQCVVTIDAAKTVTATFARAPSPVGAVTAVPTLGEWALMLMSVLCAGLGTRHLRRVP